jgi:hypothetical protein
MSFEKLIQWQREGIGNINYQEPVFTAGGTPGPAGLNTVITFTVGDGQAGSPVDGQTSLILASIQGQSLVNVQLLVIREGIALNWNSAVQIKDIRRYNHGGLGGWTFEAASGLKFFNGEFFMLFILSVNNTDQV